MSADIQVDLQNMAACEDFFAQILYSLEAELDRLDISLQANLSAWSGEAKDAYLVAHQQWQAAASEMTRNLAWLHKVIATARGNYDSTRLVTMGMWRGNA
ncbi:MAG TPA: WXG100 family type VII secretion target [Streptosporangiaceae bacterium]|jgi:WXG100 family type VII secretion target